MVDLMMGWDHDGGFGAGEWIVMVVVMVLFWGLVVAAGVLIFRGGGGSGRSAGEPRVPERRGHRDPMDILDERFARGEIEADEYEARRMVLRAGRS